MVKTQLFRLIGSKDTRKINVNHDRGENIIYWVDVKQVFPRVQYVQNNGVVVSMLKGLDGISIDPPRIKHFHNVILDVILSTEDSVEDSKFKEEVIEKLDKGLHNQQLGLHNQQLMMDRLARLQQKAEAILVQNYELLEYTIPRLCIILPETSTPWDPATIFHTKFRLHFICECGDHTKVSGSTFPNHLHLAKHEGYVIKKPTEFFRKYGPFLMTMLQLLKFGVTIAGHVVPALETLNVVNKIDSTLSAVDSVTKQLIDGIDYSIKHLEGYRTEIQKSNCVDIDGHATVPRDLDIYLERIEGLEGADLRQLGSYLEASSSDNLLGNLYRITTDKGHVKWVCIDHYHQAYKGRDQQDFEKAVQENGGSYDPQVGKVIISLGSKTRAKEFFDALTNSRRVDELDLTFDWPCSRSDLEKLEEALKKSRVPILRIDIREFKTSLGRKLLPASTKYEPLFHIVEFLNTKKIHIVLPKELDKLSDFKPKRQSDLHKLSCEMVAESMGKKEFDTLAEALKTDSILSILNLKNNPTGNSGAQALSEGLKTNSTLTTLDLSNNSIGFDGTQALSEMLKANKTLTTLVLRNNSVGDDGARVLSEALRTNKTLTTLDLTKSSIGGNGAQALSKSLKTNRTLVTLDMRGNSIGFKGILAFIVARKVNSTPITLNLEDSSGDDEVQMLSHRLTALTTLDLSNDSIGNDGTQALSDALKANSTLTTLHLTNNSIGPNGARALSEAFKTNSTLTTLNLNDNPIGDDGAQALSEALKTNSTLTTLSLRGNSIGPNGAQALSEALRTNSTLTTLNMESNSIEWNGAQALSEALKTNSTLTTLNLRYNSIGGSGAQVLSRSLKTNSTLTNLDLGNNSIGDIGAQALSKVLKTNSVLTSLSLYYKWARSSGAQALSEVFKANLTLANWGPWHNQVRSEGAEALSGAPKTNSTSALDLHNNSIRRSRVHLSEALKTNSTLTTLNLTNNSIGDNGAQALSVVIKTNSVLTALKLADNSIGDKGALALSKSLKANSTLASLDLINNSFGNDGTKALSEALKANPALDLRFASRQ